MTTSSSVAMSSVLDGWIKSQLNYSAAERSVVLVFANLLAQSTTAWTPLLVFKTIEGPRFKKGWPFVLANAVLLILTAHIISYYIKRRKTYVFFPLKHITWNNIATAQRKFGRITRALRVLSKKPRPSTRKLFLWAREWHRRYRYWLSARQRATFEGTIIQYSPWVPILAKYSDL